jgi:hypothetical protein
MRLLSLVLFSLALFSSSLVSAGTKILNCPAYKDFSKEGKITWELNSPHKEIFTFLMNANVDSTSNYFEALEGEAILPGAELIVEIHPRHKKIYCSYQADTSGKKKIVLVGWPVVDYQNVDWTKWKDYTCKTTAGNAEFCDFPIVSND